VARRSLARRSCIAIAAVVSSGLVGCKAPQLLVNNPDRHPVRIDGQRTAAFELPFRYLPFRYLPFRYYGTTRWDALPADLDRGRGPEPDWSQQPAGGTVEVPWPASPLLFPFDLPLEILSWLRGREPAIAAVRLPAAAVAAGDATASASLRARANGARAQR
jgi:hypothetical protein